MKGVKYKINAFRYESNGNNPYEFEYLFDDLLVTQNNNLIKFSVIRIKANRHKLSMPLLIAELNQKLWSNLRGGKRVWSWEKIKKLTEEWIPLVKPRIYHSNLLAKP